MRDFREFLIKFLAITEATSNVDVSILVTEASPEIPTGPNMNSNQTLIHHVIVHRESEEYHDLDEVITEKPPSELTTNFSKFIINLKIISDTSPRRDTIPHPTVTICVDSPKDEEQKSLAQTPDIEKIILERSSLASTSSSTPPPTESSNVVVVNVDEPIDINLAKTCDSSKVIYDY